MEIIDCNHHKGWFVGNFKPNLYNSKDFEFGYKRIPKGLKPDYHFHKYKTELTILIEGEIILESSNQLIKPITCIKLLPRERNDQYFTKDSLIIIINTPSIQGDKYL